MEQQKTNPNDPAFTGPTKNGFTVGLTKREYFASNAQQGILSILSNEKIALEWTAAAKKEGIGFDAYIAFLSMEAADALVLALNK